MSTNINPNLLKNFIVKTIGGDKMFQQQAQKVGVEGSKFTEADVDENAYLDLDEILQDTDLYEQFATMYVEEQDKESAVDAEKEKEEENKVKDKGNSKA